MDLVEVARRQKHYVYELLSSHSEAQLDGEVALALQFLRKSMAGSESGRLKEQLESLQKGQDRCSKHALFFFALWNDERYRKHFLYDHKKASKRLNIVAFRYFLKELEIHTNSLLKGELICLQDYVEELRKSYCITCLD